jgi:hypothetical protein
MNQNLRMNKVIKLEREFARDIGVFMLFKRQLNIEANIHALRFGCSPVSRFHNSGPAAGTDHKTAFRAFKVF